MSGKERGAAAPRGPRARSFVGRIRDGEAILRRRRRIRGGEAPQFGLLTWEVSNMQPLHLDPNEHRALFTKLLGSKPIAAQGHLGTHLDCCTKAPEARVRELDALVMDCRRGMPGAEDFRGLPSLQGMALLLHTGNHERNGYGNAAYFAEETFLTPEAIEALLAKHPAFVVIDSHGLGKSGAVHTGIDKRCEAESCHVIENADLSSRSEERRLHLRIEVELDHPSTGKPCRIWRMQTAGGREERSGL